MLTRIVRNKFLSPGYFSLRLFAPQIAAKAQVGQFVMIKVNDCSDPLLRRPMSISLKDEEHIEILYQVVGQGTKILSRKKESEELEIMGPLGNGFSLEGARANALLVAGGMGVAPLMLLSRELTGRGIKIYLALGGRTKEDILRLDFFQDLGAEIKIFTDDGSLGKKGWVTEGLSEFLSENSFPATETIIYSCGPEPMLKTVAEIARKNSLAGQVSLDRRMACGYGVCLGCVVKTKETGAKAYQCVCTCGPVFNYEDLAW